jgi:hypothetical protein
MHMPVVVVHVAPVIVMTAGVMMAMMVMATMKTAGKCRTASDGQQSHNSDGSKKHATEHNVLSFVLQKPLIHSQAHVPLRSQTPCQSSKTGTATRSKRAIPDAATTGRGLPNLQNKGGFPVGNEGIEQIGMMRNPSVRNSAKAVTAS